MNDQNEDTLPSPLNAIVYFFKYRKYDTSFGIRWSTNQHDVFR